MQLCDKASARQPRGSFAPLDSHCGGSGGGALSPAATRSCLSLIIPGHPSLDTDLGSWWDPEEVGLWRTEQEETQGGSAVLWFTK